MLRLCSTLVFLLAASVPVLPAMALQAPEQRAVDGDTIAIGKERYRLFGIDAPEKAQMCKRGGKEWACGIWSGEMLAADMAKGRVTCEAVDRDRYNRIVATCRVNGVDLAELQIKRGAAVAYAQYTKRYVALADKAKATKQGIWGAEMVNPADYRRDKRNGGDSSAPKAEPAKAETKAPKGCVIKGNINAKGTKIYHMPGQTHYEKTKINPAAGEAYFCSEAEAQAKGFTRAKQ